MIERNAGVPEDRRIFFRIGVHLGDVVEESEGDLSELRRFGHSDSNRGKFPGRGGKRVCKFFSRGGIPRLQKCDS
jgi:hypothetical protein